jgi:hypothetical protein
MVCTIEHMFEAGKLGGAAGGHHQGRGDPVPLPPPHDRGGPPPLLPVHAAQRQDAAKEMRAFGLAGFLRERFDRLYDQRLAELFSLQAAAYLAPEAR